MILMLKFVNVYVIYNYADDNTSGVSTKSAGAVCLKRKNSAQNLLPWFTQNFMAVNPSKI